MKHRKLILASGSPRRNQMLCLFGIPFTTAPAEIDEQKRRGESPIEYVERMAFEKGEAREISEDEVVLSADTIVDLEGLVLGKPVDAEDAERTLKLMRGRSHRVYTALSLHLGKDGPILSDVCLTEVYMRAYSDEEIQAYIARGDYKDKAGGYAIQDPEFHPVDRIEGCYANVMGLPFCHVYRLFRRAGISVDIDIAELCQRYNDITCEVYPSILHELKHENNQ
ncbi:MAG TPA: Maf family protein [Anaerolineaceae bacterium]|nr:Maf family protein [Anaerolineaceae bacterium]